MLTTIKTISALKCSAEEEEETKNNNNVFGNACVVVVQNSKAERKLNCT